MTETPDRDPVDQIHDLLSEHNQAGPFLSGVRKILDRVREEAARKAVEEYQRAQGAEALGRAATDQGRFR